MNFLSHTGLVFKQVSGCKVITSEKCQVPLGACPGFKLVTP